MVTSRSVPQQSEQIDSPLAGQNRRALRRSQMGQVFGMRGGQILGANRSFILCDGGEKGNRACVLFANQLTMRGRRAVFICYNRGP